MEKLSVIDSAFLMFESDESPTHVAGLLVFELPERSKSTFTRNLYNGMRKYTEAAYPFNQVVVMHRARLPTWETAERFDIDEHLESAVLDPLHEHRSAMPAGSAAK